MSCHCPDGNTVASGSKSSPPGHHKSPLMSLASIQLKLKEADRLSKLVESSMSFQLNNIGLELADAEGDCYNLFLFLI